MEEIGSKESALFEVALLQQHLEKGLENDATRHTLNHGPLGDLPTGFCVFEIPLPSRKLWFYATGGMSLFDEVRPLELFMLSDCQSPEIVELLYVTAHFHIAAEKLDTGHTVNFGKPWVAESICEFGLISQMEGAEIQWLEIDGRQIEFLWLVPITEAERDYKIRHGIDALDALFVEKEVQSQVGRRASAL